MRKIKDYFYPHSGNNHMPLLFCEAGMAVVVAVTVFLFGLSVVGRIAVDRNILTASVESMVLIDLANNDRDQNNVSPLMINPELTLAAQMKANDMVANMYFAHTSPAGITPWYWFSKAKYSFLYAGENLAVDFSESADVNNAWMNSPLHRDNILNDKFTEIGIATAEGVYKGEKTTFVVQMFGSPIAASGTTSTSSGRTVQIAKLIAVQNVSPNVAGESANTETNLIPLYTSPDFVAVKNDSPLAQATETQNGTDTLKEQATVPLQSSEATPRYTTFWQRIIASPGETVGMLYRILFFAVFIALFLMVIIKFRKQHYKNILYGVLLLLFIFAFILLLNSNLLSSPAVI